MDPIHWTKNQWVYVKSTANISTNGSGLLEITGLKQVSGSKQYTTGRILTSGTFVQTYGRWEARMKFPAGSGFWPAFWLLGENSPTCSGWPDCGELDIMENRGRLPRIASSAIHGPGYSGSNPLYNFYTLPDGAPSFMDDFHVFAMEWNENQIRFYIDSTLHFTVNKSDVQKYGNWVFNHDFHTILNLAIGGDFDGNVLPKDSEFPGKLLVDYVRVYKPGTGSVLAAQPPKYLMRGTAVLETLTAYDFSGRKRLIRSGSVTQPAHGRALILPAAALPSSR